MPKADSIGEARITLITSAAAERAPAIIIPSPGQATINGANNVARPPA